MEKKITIPKEFTLDANDNILEQIDITLLTESYSVKMDDGRTLKDAWENIRTRMVDVEIRVRELEIKLEEQNKEINKRLDEIQSLVENKEKEEETIEDVEDEVVE